MQSQRDSQPWGTTAAILGGVSFGALFWTVVVPVAAIVCGAIGLRRERTPRTAAKIGIVLGVVSLANAAAFFVLLAVLPAFLEGVAEILNEWDIE